MSANPFDTNGDGQLSEHEKLNAARSANFTQIFDRNGDGKVSIKEAVIAKQTTNFTDLLDINGNGKVSSGERAKWIDANKDGNISLQERNNADKNNDGKLQVNEVISFLLHPRGNIGPATPAPDVPNLDQVKKILEDCQGTTWSCRQKLANAIQLWGVGGSVYPVFGLWYTAEDAIEQGLVLLIFFFTLAVLCRVCFRSCRKREKHPRLFSSSRRSDSLDNMEMVAPES